MRQPNNNTVQLWDAEYAKQKQWRGWPYTMALEAIPAMFQPKSVLDVGCGLGVGLAACQKRWPDAALEGVDFSSVGLRRASMAVPLARMTEIDLNTVRAFDVTNPMPRADLVICCQTLEHVADPEVVELLLRLVAYRMLVITVPKDGRKTAHHPHSFAYSWFEARGYTVDVVPHPIPKDGDILVAVLVTEGDLA